MLFHLLSSSIVFVLGIVGVFLSRKNVILTLMSLEVMLLSVNFNFLFFSSYLDDIVGNVFILFVLCICAAETAIGLSLVISYIKWCS